MNHIGLFEGIGGFSLAAEWMGWETIAWCEINVFCQKILKQHFPKATGHGDIKTTDFSIYRGQCDIVTGGFPCQPFSSAGKRKGTEDNRYLWPEMLRAIREISPRWIVGENVRGLTNWNGGLVFDRVQADLEVEGYEVLPFLLPACGVSAPHRRDRIWFVAHAIGCISTALGTEEQRDGQRILGTRESAGQEIELQGQHNTTANPNGNGYQSGRFRESGSEAGESEIQQNKREWLRGDIGGIGEPGIIANSESGEDRRLQQPAIQPNFRTSRDKIVIANTHGDIGCEGRLYPSESETAERYIGPRNARGHERRNWQDFPTQSPVCGRNDVIPNRVDRIKALGNAIVPQLVLQIFKAIDQYEKLNTLVF